MKKDPDWNDYLEPDIEGPAAYRDFQCPKCGHKEVLPDSGSVNLNVICPKCQTKMHENTES